jgi:hypothetical protein
LIYLPPVVIHSSSMQKGSYIGTAIVLFLMVAIIVWFLYQGLSAPGGISGGSIPGTHS